MRNFLVFLNDKNHFSLFYKSLPSKSICKNLVYQDATRVYLNKKRVRLAVARYTKIKPNEHFFCNEKWHCVMHKYNVYQNEEGILPSYFYDLLKMLEGLLREMRKNAHSQCMHII